MKLVKEISTEQYRLISDTELSTNPNLYIDRSDSPIYIEQYMTELSDIVAAKDMAKVLYTTNSWSLFRSTREKRAVAKLMAYSLIQTELDEVLTPQEQTAAKEIYVANSKIARATRWEHLRQQLALQVTELEALSFYTDTKGFKDDYIDAGLPHLTMWLTNGVYAPLGIDYSTNGFAQTSYYTTSMLQMCIDYLIIGKQFEVK